MASGSNNIEKPSTSPRKGWPSGSAGSYIAIHKIEAGARRPSRQIVELLADLFKVPAEEREAFISFARGKSEEEDSVRGGQVIKLRCGSRTSVTRGKSVVLLRVDNYTQSEL